MAIVDETQYTLLPYEVIETLNEKLEHLLSGRVLFIKQFEQRQFSDVLVRLVDKKFTVSQISYDIKETPNDPRYWVTFNLGINDLSLFTCFNFDEGLFTHEHKYTINDTVHYISADGQKDSAVVLEVYVSKLDPNQYAYRLSRDPNGLYAEEDLIQQKYQ